MSESRPPSQLARESVAYNPVDVQVGARVRALRRLKGVTQQELADATGVSFQQIQKYERGHNRISASMIVRIATKLGVAPGELFEEELTSAGFGEAVVLLSLPGALDLLRNFARLPPGPRSAVTALLEAMIEESGLS